MNEVLQQLHDRRSVRVYQDRPVEPDVKQAILEAAIQAPTAGNMALRSAATTSPLLPPPLWC